MCGIYVTTKCGRISEMQQALLHRGPDAQDSKSYGGSVFIGQNRLAIVDTQQGRGGQPFVGNNYVCAFNGEIFNYKALQSGAHQTEVEVLGGLMKAQHDLAQLLNGYYAIAFHDISRDEVVLARDFYGVMPLYYTNKWGEFEAASEQHALLREGVTIEDVRVVPANSKVTYDLQTRRISIQSFSSLFRLATHKPTCQQFINAVDATIMHSEVGFSVALSGGLDSSLVLAAVRDLDEMPEAIITTYAQSDDRSELERAELVVNRFGMQHLWKVVPVETFDVRSRLPHANPIRDFAFQRHATVAKHSPTKVILCGEGADELGLGYPVNKELKGPVERYLKKVSLLKSQASMTLDRVNMAGMMFSKEYRVPFLDIEFSLACLANDQTNKQLFREYAEMLDVPTEVIQASKYSAEETTGRAVAYD